MVDQIRCKRIIDGKTYNTETATLLGFGEQDDGPWEKALYKNRHGAYFLYIENMADLREEIKPLQRDAAQTWMEHNCSAEKVETEFGEMPEAGDPEARFTLRLPETLRRRAAAVAETRGQSLNAWIQRCVERGVDESDAADER